MLPSRPHLIENVGSQQGKRDEFAEQVLLALQRSNVLKLDRHRAWTITGRY